MQSLLKNIYEKLARYFAMKAGLSFGDITLVYEDNIIVVKNGNHTFFKNKTGISFAFWIRALSDSEIKELNADVPPTKGLTSYNKL